MLPALAGAGAHLIEVGVPFSDPIADGPVIQAAYTRALAAKFKLADMLDTVKAAVTAAPGWDTPLVAMGSYSLIWKRGPAKSSWPIAWRRASPGRWCRTCPSRRPPTWRPSAGTQGFGLTLYW